MEDTDTLFLKVDARAYGKMEDTRLPVAISKYKFPRQSYFQVVWRMNNQVLRFALDPNSPNQALALKN